jgi:hypothetical protein
MCVRGKGEKRKESQRIWIKRKRSKEKTIRLRLVLLNKHQGLCNNIVKGLLF